MGKSHLALVSPLTENCTVVDESAIVSFTTNPVPSLEPEVPQVDPKPEPKASRAEPKPRRLHRARPGPGSGPGRRTNAALRTREHLAQHEIERLLEAAGRNRHGRRDALMLLLAFRHALRAAEVVDLRWDQVDFKTAHLHVRRVKNGRPSTHPLTGRELRELRKHQSKSRASAFIFISERGAPLTAPGFSRMVERAGVVADLGLKVHAHMLRHSTGFKLANDGHDTRSIQDYMGHANIQNTARYTALAPGRFRDFWRD